MIAILLSTREQRESCMSEKFGEKLRKIRTSKNMTQEELATVLGSSKAYVWQLENKKNAKPSEPSDRQIEDAFFRKFHKLSENDKRTIERIVSGFDDED